MLTIEVKKVVFSASGAAEEDAGEASQAGGSSDSSTLHVSGPVTNENQFVKLGAYHTLDLEAGRDFTLIKSENGWDSIGKDRVRVATAEAGGAEVAAIVCGEGRLFQVGSSVSSVSIVAKSPLDCSQASQISV